MSDLRPLRGIHSWSHSKLTDFEKCKYRTFLLHVKRVPEPQRPLPPGKTEHANDRGSRVHEAAEHFVNGARQDLVPELHSFRKEFMRLRELYQLGVVSLEGEWGYDREWNPTDWKTAWHRSKLDILVHTSKHSALVADVKTGRKTGNELKHGEQVQLYALDTVLRFPHLEEVTTELWYVDQDEITSKTFTRAQALKFKHSFDRRGEAITTCTEWPANANVITCRWCQYGGWGSGDCKAGVKPGFNLDVRSTHNAPPRKFYPR